MLSKLPPQAANPALLVGYETGDDAAVYKVNKDQGVVATTDFFMPIVDDPFDYGRIAATNALSDVYAIGGKPIMALAIAGFPMDKMSTDQVQKILAGGTQTPEFLNKNPNGDIPAVESAVGHCSFESNAILTF